MKILIIYLSLVTTILFSFISYIPFIIPFSFLLIIILMSTRYKSIIDYRVGFLLITVAYSFVPILIYILNQNYYVGIGRNDLFSKYEEVQINVLLFQYIGSFLIGICLHIAIRENNFFLIKNKSYNQSSIGLNFLSLKIILTSIFLLLIITTQLNWGRILEEYTLENISLVFFATYFLFHLFSMKIIKNNKLGFGYLLLMASIVIILSYIGVRQTIFWGILLFLLSSLLYQDARGYKIHIKLPNTKTIFYIILVIFIFAFAVIFRNTRELSDSLIIAFTNFSYVYELSIRLFLAEVFYTYINLLIIVGENLNGSINPIKIFNDLVLQLVPRQIFATKYDYMNFIHFQRSYNITPFGSWYIIGFFSSFAKYPWLLIPYTFLYCEIINLLISFSSKLTKNKIEFTSYYAVIYIFCSIYIVRSTIFGGIKNAISIIIISFIISIILRSFFRRQN